MKVQNVLLSAWLLLFMAGNGWAQLRMPAVFGDHMVLQQRVSVNVWGWGKPGTKVSVKGSWPKSKGEAVVDSVGNWTVKLPTPASGGPHTLEIKGIYRAKGEPKQDTLILYEDVLIGEVWVCSGQSNMHWPVRRADRAEEEIAQAEYPSIRLFTVKQQYSRAPLSDTEGEWVLCSPETVADFSAVGYFFGREIHQRTQQPVGLIHSSWGGTPIEAWMSYKGLSRVEAYQPELDKLKLLYAATDSVEAAYASELDAWFEGAMAQMNAQTRAEMMADQGWRSLELPQLWEDAGQELGKLDGAVWFKKELDLPAEWAGKPLRLELGPIDDMDITWFNQEEIGSHQAMGQHAVERTYDIPASLVKEGKNVLVVKVMDLGGGGGFRGAPEAMQLRPAAEDAPAMSLAGRWAYKVEVALTDLPPRPRKLDVDGPRAPMNLYNGMIAPIIPYNINGVLWYQGEANTWNPEMYRELFPAMIMDWRFRWNIGDFSFFYVQLAPFNYEPPRSAPHLREAQLEGLDLRNTGMVVTMDIGDPTDIHPTNKQEVGRRLSLIAMNKAFGYVEEVYSGPIYDFMKMEGDKIRIYFEHTHGGLDFKGDSLTHFEVAGKDQVFHPAQAVIQGETILVSSEEVPAPVAVRYAFSNGAEPNLYNLAGLPASPFRTDDWER